MKVILEGVDGSGKTTVANLMSRRLGWIPYATPPAVLRARRTQIDAFASNDEHYRFYLEGIRIASQELSEFGEEVKVVIDRYWLSTYVYHAVMGVQVDLRDFENIHQGDMTFLLRISSDEQMRRLTKRGMSIGDMRMLQQQQQLREAYDQIASTLKLYIIDTDQRTPEEVCEIIVSRLCSL